MNRAVVAIIFLVLTSCGGPVPRKPVKVKSGSFFTESVERSKKLLAKEQGIIQEIMEADTTHTYLTSSSGFSYYFDSKRDSLAYRPQVDDQVTLTYNLRTLTNDTIYSAQDIGTITMRVDKEQLFPGMRGAVKLVAEGETATFLFPSSLAYGYHGDGHKIPPITPLKSSVTVLKIEKRQDSIN